jgi:flagellar hook-associated protein 2
MATSATSAASFFNGSSTFSTDLQNVITRAVGIANLPITLLQNQQSTLTAQQTELQTLGSDFQALQNNIGTVDSAVSSGSLAASVASPTVASAAVGAGALAGTYSLAITNLGSQTNTISNATLPSVADPSAGNISTSSTFTLTVGGGSPITLTPTGSSLDSLVAAINASGANVQATVVNVGGSATPNYELSIQGTQYAATAIQLNDGAQNLLTTLSTGSPVTYTVNGQPSGGATSTTRALAISTGLTVTALAAGSTSVTVSESGSGVESALSSLVTTFNAATDELTKNRGQNGGALTGQSVISQLSQVLQGLTSYSSSSSGSVQSLTDLGLSFDTNGHLQFDSTAFESTASSSLSDIMSFLGSATANTGFLGAASAALTSVTDLTTGSIVTQISSLADSVSNLTAKITADQSRVALLQTNLTAQMVSADAAIASLQSQSTEINAMFAAEAQASKNITG